VAAAEVLAGEGAVAALVGGEVPGLAVDLEPGLGAVAGQALEPAPVRGHPSARGRMHPSGPARMPPLVPERTLRSAWVRMPRQAPAARSVMGPVMGPPTGQGTKGSGLKTAPDSEHPNDALESPAFDSTIGAVSSKG
jgi:hypothetical protein